MAYPYPYQTPYYPTYQPPMPDQLAQLRQGQMQQQMQPMQTPMQPANTASNQQNGIIWVGSKMEADNYLVVPNSAVALWDMNNPVVYLRQADSTGKPSTKVYDLVERASPSAVPHAQQTQYASLDAFNALEERVAALEAKPCKCSEKRKAKEETESA